MSLTVRQLALAPLARQLLLERRRIGVEEAVRRVCALQAQTPASPCLALWNRVQDFAPEDLDAAFEGRRIVKATLMRITLHVVHAEGYAPCHAAMLGTLRAARLYDRRFTSLRPRRPRIFQRCSPTVTQPSTGATDTGFPGVESMMVRGDRVLDPDSSGLPTWSSGASWRAARPVTRRCRERCCDQADHAADQFSCRHRSPRPILSTGRARRTGWGLYFSPGTTI
ncbi:DNA glycosylase AlkZ-like family protein [Streptomyces sp. NPDC005794]|uniref:DNA glycosylase AlkZ-like family protein n=1 Tax=Streptomyces sp. NPDC005794 TaxID=3364733 RepID=UPI0036B77EB2